VSVAESTPPRPAGAIEVAALVLRPGGAELTQECVAQEVAVSLELDGTPHVVMLATPADLEDFALGFCLTEGLIDEPDDLRRCEIRLREKGIVLALSLAPSLSEARVRRRRNMAGRTGCGLCGTDDLDQVVRLPAEALPSTRIRGSVLERAMRELGSRQPLAQATGATHAAAFCDLDGRILLVREDVGRHNALDKLIGAMLRGGLDPNAGFIAVTSRASVEMVQKTAIAGVSILAAVSAPTQLAIQCARNANLLLAGFVREDRATIYAGASRVQDGD
jgi:FdhD protein